MLKLLSLFSGIGAFEKALENIGEPFDVIRYCEIDKYASKAYSLIHNLDENMNLKDVCSVNTTELPDDIDIITYGFPCQDISIAGKQKGFLNEEGELTRSGLFFEALRIIEETKPKIAIAENVKALTSKKFSAEFKIVLDSLNDAGYKNYWAVLNAKDYGIPQNRERVFIISIRDDIDHGFHFPEKYELKLRLKDLLEDSVDEKYYLSDTMIQGFLKHNVKHEAKGTGFKWKPTDTHGVANCLRANAALCPTDNTVTVLLKNQASEVTKETDIANTLLARDYKGFGNQEMNAVIEINSVKPERLFNIYGEDKGTGFAGNVWNKNGLSPTLQTAQGGNRQPMIIDDSHQMTIDEFLPVKEATKKGVVVNNDPVIQRIEIPQTVSVRKYEVDKEKLVKILRHQKKVCGWSNKDLAEELEVPLTQVEHWFRTDKHFSIPNPEIWSDLKWLLEMDDINEFDEAIMTFEDREGVYDKAERYYHENGIAPTITVAVVNEKIITDDGCARTLMGEGGNQNDKTGQYLMPNLRIRKLTPKECFRLMGFDDKDCDILVENKISNTQLYKMAGNSIVVDVLEEIFVELLNQYEDVFPCGD